MLYSRSTATWRIRNLSMNRKEDVKKLYNKYGEKMCLAPFVNSFYSTCGVVGLDQTVNNFVRPCSIIQAGERWNIQNSSITDSRNSDIWKNMRQSFLDGVMPDLCGTCINAERVGASSPRQLNNEYLFEHLDVDIMAEVQQIVEAGLVAGSVYADAVFSNNAAVLTVNSVIDGGTY